MQKQKYSFFWKQKGKLKDSGRRTAEQALEDFRKEKIAPIYPYPVSSVEQNMFLAHLEEAIEIAKAKDASKLLEKARKMIALTPYTNWSGD